MCHSWNLLEGTSSHGQGRGSQKLRAAEVRSGVAPGGLCFGAATLLALEAVRTPGAWSCQGRRPWGLCRDWVRAGRDGDSHSAVTAVIQARRQEPGGRGGDGEGWGVVTGLGGRR